MTLYQKLLLFIGLGVNIQTISADLTLDGGSEHFQVLTPSGANRAVTLDAPGSTVGIPSTQGLWYVIRCDTAASYSVLVKNGGTTLVTLAPGDWAYVASGGALGSATWKVMASSAGLSTLTLSGALTAASAVINGSLSAVAAAFTGAVTTTDGVTSGPVRKVGGLVSTKTSSTTLTNSTAETVIATYTLPANTLKAGTVLRIRGGARVSGVTGTPNVGINVRIGGLSGTVIASSGGVAVIGNDVLTADMLVSSRAAPSASSALVSEGVARWTASGVGGQKPFLSAPTNAATNGALDLVLTGQWDAASSSNILVGEAFVIEVVG